ncbi:MAG: hypothetical protein IJB96_00450 [Lachnospira sp.]|nr:hypothetical protein [Lachnospira sp.]
MAIRKEKMPKEQETKFKDLPFGQKLSYIWEYYKIHMIALVLVAGVIASAVYYYHQKNFDSVCEIIVVDGLVEDYGTRQDAITKGFTEHLGIDGTSTRVMVNYGYSLDYIIGDQEATVTQNKVYILASTGKLDGYLTEEEHIDHFSSDKELFLFDLREILTKEELEKIGEENFFYYTKQDGTKYPIAVNLSDTKIKKEFKLTTEKPYYGVVITAPNKENGIEFIRWAFDL